MPIFKRVTLMENSDEDPVFLDLETSGVQGEVDMMLVSPSERIIGRFFIEDLIAALELLRVERGSDIHISHDPHLGNRHEEEDIPF